MWRGKCYLYCIFKKHLHTVIICLQMDKQLLKHIMCFLPLLSNQSMLFTEFTRVYKGYSLQGFSLSNFLKRIVNRSLSQISCVVLFSCILFMFILSLFRIFFSENMSVRFWEHDKLLLRHWEDNTGGILPLPVSSESLSQPYFKLQNWMEIHRGMCWSLD